MIPPVYQLMTGTPAISAIVATRVFGSGIATQGETRPYIVWQIATAVPNNNLSETPEQDQQRVQIDVYAMSETACRQLATLVRNAIEGVMHIEFGPWNTYEPDTKLYRWSMDVTWFLDR